MAECLAGHVSDFGPTGRVLLEVDGTEIGVFRMGDGFYAYENKCLHQGGPACEGLILGKVEQPLAPDKTAGTERFSTQVLHFVCPWHGWEYEMATGRCAADKSLRLKSFEVVRRGDEVYVRT